MNTENTIQSPKHSPWDRMSHEDKINQARLQGARPIKWTLDLELAGQISADGYVWVYAGGPLGVDSLAEPKRRADGKIDGRSKGARKCGKCGKPGHNARTCGQNRSKAIKLPASMKPGYKRPEPSEAPPAPQVASEAVVPVRSEAQSEARGSKKGARKCGKCGKPGHNARTCGKSGPKVKRARSRQNQCGKCGKFGHNARTCKN